MIRVYGLGLLGYVTAACVASWGHDTVMMYDSTLPEVPDEPGLVAALRREEKRGFLRPLKIGTEEPNDVVWLTYDTPINKNGHANVEWVAAHAHNVLDRCAKRTLVLVSSQVPVGFSSELQRKFPRLRIASVPENVRRGKALSDFDTRTPIVGLGEGIARTDVQNIFGRSRQILVMSRESAEITKQLRNAYLAMCIAFANEGSQLCEAIKDASYDAVERALRTDERIGPLAYIAKGKADGRHLLRDVRYLTESNGVALPLMRALLQSWAS